ncbi:hypothetical protein PTTG_28144 [Puccinia triticina 1-1 BBBD Race 1]|uniref:Secreted protein n=2 Tax=Puccinia triticina TaxID=208348 RepID=A0A180GEL6_PUCT1|nr:uncharacterized protein PtA15_17A89 [Puccinia triticina]OAV90979.1 hypothetical protein PTTG_28144 [Puccinia triticina 1-1 BBBD Race 1]WAQ92608.1 hypothetical protein PtA15_17A89 [Puccinia triticina]
MHIFKFALPFFTAFHRVTSTSQTHVSCTWIHTRCYCAVDVSNDPTAPHWVFHHRCRELGGLDFQPCATLVPEFNGGTKTYCCNENFIRSKDATPEKIKAHCITG